MMKPHYLRKMGTLVRRNFAVTKDGHFAVDKNGNIYVWNGLPNGFMRTTRWLDENIIKSILWFIEDWGNVLNVAENELAERHYRLVKEAFRKYLVEVDRDFDEEIKKHPDWQVLFDEMKAKI